eukprot:GHVR01057263.1.p1 GENE.GHVR01057263.1~~GHVR01057263.1.p1  ORF type:complete len:361 (+),score=52.75 GHVR01057263.1:38-1120(+)
MHGTGLRTLKTFTLARFVIFQNSALSEKRQLFKHMLENISGVCALLWDSAQMRGGGRLSLVPAVATSEDGADSLREIVESQIRQMSKVANKGSQLNQIYYEWGDKIHNMRRLKESTMQDVRMLEDVLKEAVVPLCMSVRVDMYRALKTSMKMFRSWYLSRHDDKRRKVALGRKFNFLLRSKKELYRIFDKIEMPVNTENAQRHQRVKRLRLEILREVMLFVLHNIEINRMRDKLREEKEEQPFLFKANVRIQFEISGVRNKCRTLLVHMTELHGVGWSLSPTFTFSRGETVSLEAEFWRAKALFAECKDIPRFQAVDDAVEIINQHFKQFEVRFFRISAVYVCVVTVEIKSSYSCSLNRD